MDSDAASAGAGILMMLVMFVIWLAVIVFCIAIGWKIFSKAGQEGWKSIIPIYNTWVLVVDIIGRSPLWFVLTLIPCVNIVIAIILMIDLAKVFGKGTGFGLGLAFLNPIFAAILAFGDAEYEGPIEE